MRCQPSQASESTTPKPEAPAAAGAKPVESPSKAATPGRSEGRDSESAKLSVTSRRSRRLAVRRSSAELHFTETTILRGEAVEPGEATAVRRDPRDRRSRRLRTADPQTEALLDLLILH